MRSQACRAVKLLVVVVVGVVVAAAVVAGVADDVVAGFVVAVVVDGLVAVCVSVTDGFVVAVVADTDEDLVADTVVVADAAADDDDDEDEAAVVVAPADVTEAVAVVDFDVEAVTCVVFNSDTIVGTLESVDEGSATGAEEEFFTVLVLLEVILLSASCFTLSELPKSPSTKSLLPFSMGLESPKTLVLSVTLASVMFADVLLFCVLATDDTAVVSLSCVLDSGLVALLGATELADVPEAEVLVTGVEFAEFATLCTEAESAELRTEEESEAGEMTLDVAPACLLEAEHARTVPTKIGSIPNSAAAAGA
jgi:hypothetical protein